MKPVRAFRQPEQIEFFLRLHGLWEGIIHLPRPPPPPFDIDTIEPIEPPWQAIKEWIPDDDPDLNWFNQEMDPTGAEAEHDPFEQSPAGNQSKFVSAMAASWSSTTREIQMHQSFYGFYFMRWHR